MAEAPGPSASSPAANTLAHTHSNRKELSPKGVVTPLDSHGISLEQNLPLYEISPENTQTPDIDLLVWWLDKKIYSLNGGCKIVIDHGRIREKNTKHISKFIVFLLTPWDKKHCCKAIYRAEKKGHTPPKFNIAPEKWWLEDEFPFGIAYL